MNAAKVKCFVIGHTKPKTMIIETENHIYTQGCLRCKSPLGLPALCKTAPPPPNSTPEQLEEWNEFREHLREEILATINKNGSCNM